MEVSPQTVSGATFSIVKKGFDPDEVRGFLSQVAQSLTKANDHASTMEQRARQAVIRMQQAEQAAASVAPAVVPTSPPEPARAAQKLDDTETISRTLLLAQRTADEHIAAAKADATSMTTTARTEAERLVREAHEQAALVIADSRSEARRSADAERSRAEEELQRLLARLEFLREDVRQLDGYASAQRDRLRAASLQLKAVADGELGESRPPVLSAASDEVVRSSAPISAADDEVSAPAAAATAVAASETSVSQDSTVAIEDRFDAPAADGRAPTPARGYSADDTGLFNLRASAASDSELELDLDDDITAEVPIIDPDATQAIKISGDDL
jgi:DivIVA domain-containing protein